MQRVNDEEESVLKPSEVIGRGGLRINPIHRIHFPLHLQQCRTCRHLWITLLMHECSSYNVKQKNHDE
jgi:hypothetical protein